MLCLYSNVFTLIETLLKVQSNTYIKARGLSKKTQLRDAQLARRLEDELKIGAISRLDYGTSRSWVTSFNAEPEHMFLVHVLILMQVL